MEDQRDYAEESSNREDAIREGLDEAGYVKVPTTVPDLREGDFYYSKELGWVEIEDTHVNADGSVTADVLLGGQTGQAWFERGNAITVRRLPGPSVWSVSS